MFFLDIFPPFGYNVHNFIGQFVTILSVNKTRELMGAVRPFFVGGGHALRPFLF